MNYKLACEKLGIVIKEDNETSLLEMEMEIPMEELKRKYRMMALLYHPDKNHSPDAVSKFQEIQESYEYLLKYEGYKDSEEDDDIEDDERNQNSSIFKETNFEKYTKTTSKYFHILFSFLKTISREQSKEKDKSSLFYTILKNLLMKCDKPAFEMLKKLDKTTLLKIYEIMKKYKDVLYLDEDFITKIQDILSEKIKNDECIILNPQLEDLFENNLYKIKVNGFTYIVPLWHNELVYDNSGCDVYVKCFPILPENMEIDEKNNIHIYKNYKISEIWDKPIMEINLINQSLPIDVSLLKLRREQIIHFVGNGISRINTENVYDISKKGDVILHIQLEL
jgi:hypothetical protein